MSGNDNENNEVETTANSLEEQLDLLTEKSGLTRELAFQYIIDQFKSTFHEEFLEKRRVTLLEAVKRGLRKGTIPEKQLASKTGSLICLTLGADSEEIYKELSPIYQEMINNPTLSDDVRCAVCESYAITCFIGNADEAVTITSLELFSKLFSDRSNTSSLQVAAMESWNLLATTVSTQYIFDHFVHELLPTFFSLLQSENVDARVAAGECIALLFEIGREVEQESFDLYKFGYFGGVNVDDLLDTLNELVSDKTKSRAKKDKLKQKAPFKEVIATVEEGDYPHETLSFLHQKLEFSSWSEILQLDAIRRLLGTGLQTHFENNPLLLEIFDVNLDKNVKKVQLSQIEKRMILSPNSAVAKFRTRNRNEQRFNKSQLKL